MRKTSLAFAGNLLLVAGLALTLNACSTKNPSVVVPDTQPGDQLLAAYMIGDWCTNREETSNANRAAGLEENPVTMEAIHATLVDAMVRVRKLLDQFFMEFSNAR